MAFSDFLGALKSAPSTGAELNKAEAKLIAERQRVATAPVHIDDVVAKAMAGTRKRASDAVEKLVRNHLNAESMAATHPDSIENDAIVFDLLSLGEGAPYPAKSGTDKATIFPQGNVPHAGMLAYLLGPQIEKASEALVREHLTKACKGGIRLADRRAKLADIDTKLAAIRQQRAELAEGLREAARHLQGAPEAFANGPSDAAIAAEAAEYERATGERILGSN